MHDFVYIEFLSKEKQSQKAVTRDQTKRKKNGVSRYSYGVAFEVLKIFRNYIQYDY